jgi:HD-like signal output (HDOD) protein
MEQPLQIPGLVDLVSNLPPFQKVMEQCMLTLSKPYSSAKELGRWIESDTALSGKVLSLANSSFYGQPQKVSSASQAVVLLGRRALEETFFSIYIQGLFQSQGDPEVSRMWAHSLSCGLAARELVQMLGLPSAEGQETPDGGAYLAGLLHDAGKLLILTNYPEAHQLAKSQLKQRARNIIEAERLTWGFDHAELGEAMARKWGLHETILEAVRWHHEPERAVLSPELTALVHVGDLLARYGEAAPRALERVHPVAMAILGLGEDSQERLAAVDRNVREKMAVYDHLLQSNS